MFAPTQKNLEVKHPAARLSANDAKKWEDGVNGIHVGCFWTLIKLNLEHAWMSVSHLWSLEGIWSEIFQCFPSALWWRPPKGPDMQIQTDVVLTPKKIRMLGLVLQTFKTTFNEKSWRNKTKHKPLHLDETWDPGIYPLHLSRGSPVNSPSDVCGSISEWGGADEEMSHLRLPSLTGDETTAQLRVCTHRYWPPESTRYISSTLRVRLDSLVGLKIRKTGNTATDLETQLLQVQLHSDVVQVLQ